MSITKNTLKLVVTNLTLSLIMTGCSFHLDKKTILNYQKGIVVEDYTDYNSEKSVEDIDKLIGFGNNHKINHNNFTYLINNTYLTPATLATVLEETTITNKSKLLDGKTEMPYDIFNHCIIQPITLPKSFVVDNIYEVNKLIEYFGNCDITCQKLFTLDNETLYYFKSVFTFDSNAKHLVIEAEDGDTITAESLYRVDEDENLELLYKNQKGIKEDCPNVVEANYNNDTDNILIPIENTVFSNIEGKQKESYLREALDVYSGEDNYYSEENEDIDFTIFSK